MVTAEQGLKHLLLTVDVERLYRLGSLADLVPSVLSSTALQSDLNCQHITKKYMQQHLTFF